MADKDDEPKIIVDDDWKQQAQKEKEQLSETVEQQAAAAAMPPADFQTLVSTLLTQALFAMGAVQMQDGKRPPVNLELAKHHIDMLAVLDEKTKGNLTDDEKKMLDSALYELRMSYVQLASGPAAPTVRP